MNKNLTIATLSVLSTVCVAEAGQIQIMFQLDSRYLVDNAMAAMMDDNGSVVAAWHFSELTGALTSNGGDGFIFYAVAQAEFESRRYTIEMSDSGGDGWNSGGTIGGGMVFSPTAGLLGNSVFSSGSDKTFGFGVPAPGVLALVGLTGLVRSRRR